MAQYDAEARTEYQHIDIPRLGPEKNPYQEAGYHRFQEITHEYNETCLYSHDAQGVGASRIAAAVLAYINSLGPAVNETGLE